MRTTSPSERTLKRGMILKNVSAVSDARPTQCERGKGCDRWQGQEGRREGRRPTLVSGQGSCPTRGNTQVQAMKKMRMATVWFPLPFFARSRALPPPPPGADRSPLLQRTLGRRFNEVDLHVEVVEAGGLARGHVEVAAAVDLANLDDLTVDDRAAALAGLLQLVVLDLGLGQARQLGVVRIGLGLASGRPVDQGRSAAGAFVSNPRRLTAERTRSFRAFFSLARRLPVLYLSGTRICKGGAGWGRVGGREGRGGAGGREGGEGRGGRGGRDGRRAVSALRPLLARSRCA